MILIKSGDVMSLGYVPDRSDAERMRLKDHFRQALRDLPFWAVSNAFDEWTRTRTRSASPAEIKILVSEQIRPITEELERRRRAKAEMLEAQAERDRKRVDPEVAARILAEAGMSQAEMDRIKNGNRMVTPATRYQSPDEIAESEKHWTEGKSSDSPEMELLRKARSSNPIMREAQKMNRG